MSVSRWAADVARTEPGRPAIIDRGVTITYGELEMRSLTLAQRLRAAGYGKGSRIATLSGATADQVVLLFACAKIGAALVPLSWRLTREDLERQLDLSEPDLLVVEDEFSRMLPTKELAMPVAGFASGGVESQVPGSWRPADAGEAAPTDPLLMVFTSGSSGATKAVVLSQAACGWANLALMRAVPLRSDDVVLQVLPQFHVAGWNVQPLAAWWSGATVVLERTFDAGRALALIERYGVTAMMGVPATYRAMAEHMDLAHRDLSSLRVPIVGGGLLDQRTSDRIAQVAARPLQGYGLTEAGPNVSLDATGSHGDSVGRPYPGVDVALLIDGSVVTGPGRGELLVSSPALFDGYYANVEATAAALFDGWLRTGDLVEIDQAGDIRIIDRLKDVVRSGGETIAPLEVERALLAHEGIRDAAVAGVPSADWGERVVAWIVADDALSDDEILDFLDGRLARFKHPRQLVRVSAIPKTVSGKALRRVLVSAFEGAQQ